MHLAVVALEVSTAYTTVDDRGLASRVPVCAALAAAAVGHFVLYVTVSVPAAGVIEVVVPTFLNVTVVLP